MMRDATGVFNGGMPVLPTVDLVTMAVHCWPATLVAGGGACVDFQELLY